MKSLLTAALLSILLSACAEKATSEAGRATPERCESCPTNASCVEEECVCDQGFAPGAGDSCQDIDECLQDNGGCAEVCTNLVGSFACSCSAGSSLSPEGSCVEEACPGCALCGDSASLDERLRAARAHYESIADGLSAEPVSEALLEDTHGTLSVGVHEHAIPVFASGAGVFIAASQLGEGRVVAFSGQDYISSQSRSTLLPQEGIAGLVANAAQWATGGAPIDALVANENVADLLHGAGANARVAEIRRSEGLEEPRDWSAEALAGTNLAVVQVNEWGTLHLDAEDVEPLREFVRGGGGLLLAGSALHWSWWLDWTAEENQGDALLRGTGISFVANSVRAVNEGRLGHDPQDLPIALWCAYVQGEEVDSGRLSRLPPLFGAASAEGRNIELDLGLSRVVAETPALPVSRDNARALLSANIAAGLRGHSWPVEHPWAATFPGSVADGAERVSETIFIDARNKRARPMGLYAPPGERVTVEVGPTDAAMGLAVRVGELHDDNRSLDHIDPWQRAPLTFQQTPINDTETLVGSGLGGSLYLVVPEDYADAEISLTVSGAVRQALYDHGVTEPGAFARALAGGAPRAIIQQERKVRMVVGTGPAQGVADPGEVMDFWGGFYDSHSRLAREPAVRPYESDWIFDIQVGWGYANATPDRLNFPPNSEGWALRTKTGDEDWWLFAHELGHQWQTRDWSGGDVTEVCVNLFSMYTINHYLNEGGDRETRGFKDNRIDHGLLRGSRWATADLFGKLELYRQLVFEFGWQTFERVFASYYDADFPRQRYGDFMDGFALRFSALTGRDITPFLDHWEYPLSAGARESVRAFGLPEWLPPGWD